jgi:predicted Rossmann fold nucleotide-binding protein DprA/Smf involved in DNA uptake
VVGHPPQDSRKRAFCVCDSSYPPKPYLARNHEMVMVTDRLVVVPKRQIEEVRSGTWATFRYALKLGRPIYVVWPDGTIAVRNV